MKLPFAFRLRLVSLASLAVALCWASTPARAALDAPVSPNAQPNVAQLLQFLDSVKGTYILSGQQEIAWSLSRENEDFDYILKTTGKTPAVRGFDFLQYVYSPSVRANQDATERAIAWAKSGGIVNFCCHMFMNLGSTNGQPQFYVPSANNGNGTTFDISQAVITGTPENVEYLAKLDIIATELKRLRDAGVVVVWRPFHECSGGWFWWGAKGATPFKAAWRIMFDRFTGMHGLNNLIWVYNPTDPISSNLPGWYPGDDVVDMISIDVYPSAGQHPVYAAEYTLMKDFKAGRKVVTMSENGAIPDIDAMFTAGANWSYFCTWNGFENDLARNSATFLNTVYNHAKVITLDELPALYTPNAWAITTEPKTQMVVAGSTLSLSVGLSAGSPASTYQWLKDGAAISGATSAAYSVANVAASASGTYTVTATSTAGTLTSAPAIVTVAATDNGRIVNLSVRADAGTADQTLIVGFVMDGNASKTLLLRALGPTLGAFGVTNFLADPIIQLNTTPKVINDNWGANGTTTVAEFKTAFTQLGAVGLDSDTSKDAALLLSLPAAPYSASMLGAGGTSGTVLAEIYDTTPTVGSRLVNISARSKVGGGSDLIAGFVISGDYRTVLIRGVAGQTLGNYGVTGSLENTKLELYRSINGSPSALYLSNDEWTLGPTAISTLKSSFSAVGAFPLLAASHDATMLVTLAPGVYSVQVKSVDAALSGVSLVEIYEVR